MPQDERPVEQQRTLPNNLEAERSILGAAMIENETWSDIALLVTAKD